VLHYAGQWYCSPEWLEKVMGGWKVARKVLYALILPVVLALFVVRWNVAAAGAEQTSKVEQSIEVLNEIMKVPDQGMPESLLRNAYGIAIIPDVIKVGFVVGGRRGRGVLLVRTASGAWSDPSFVTLTGGSVGWQIGAQSSDVILVFKSRKSVDNIVKGKFTLGADAAVAAGPVGRQAAAATDAEFKAEIYSYSRSRGLFAGVSLDGSVLEIDHDANRQLYGKSGLDVSRILASTELPAPAVVFRLRHLLVKYAPTPAGMQ
jgi:lipid-binding SYLF domain-containing protein